MYNPPKKKLYGSSLVSYMTILQYYIQVKDIVSMIDKIIEDSRPKPFSHSKECRHCNLPAIEEILMM